MDRTIPINEFPKISVFDENVQLVTDVSVVHQDDNLYVINIESRSETAVSPTPITIRWKLPSTNMKGVWKSGGIYDKRRQYDWELEHLRSRISVDAPVIGVFGHDDANAITFACSDAINLIESNALFREEDNMLYCHVTFFAERHPEITSYDAQIRIDLRDIPYSQSLEEVGLWWESFANMKPAPVPDIARAPLYSTWYNFHQDLDEKLLIEECKAAYDIGYELIILDDGWQTMDNNRGYDYTGDWQPDRFPDMAAFVRQVHATGMKIGVWFSVPFCGKKSKAYQKFAGKFLTENHRWAPVFDPRYPEVREHLISIYTKAVKDWNLDALKLDFIDDFDVYPETELTMADGRDYANVNEAVDRLLTDAMEAVKTINPNIGIEFRQKYIGPALRKHGNMFRAFDCPNDPATNRVRTTDIKLLIGNSAVHSDMLTWHPEESVEMAALQILNGLYAVPQMSILLTEANESYLKMISHYTQYWKDHAEILLDGAFIPISPLANYPILQAHKDGHHIITVFEEQIGDVSGTKRIDVINAKYSDTVVLRYHGLPQDYEITAYDCMGHPIGTEHLEMDEGVIDFRVPISGMIKMIAI